MKQTSIDWLFEKLCKNKDINIALKSNFYTATKVFEQAKEMEKEQMSRIYEGLLQNVGTSIKQSDLPTFEQYYNETYVSKDIALQNQLESKVITELSNKSWESCDGCSPEEYPKQVWEEIIDTCGGKEEFMKLAGLSPKQETLEEAAENFVNSTRLRNYKVLFIEGAKWQQEQILQFLYSEITERRPYSSSKMCEVVIEFIEQLNTKK